MLSSSSLTSMLNEGCEPLTEFPRILLAEIDLVVRAANPEPLAGRRVVSAARGPGPAAGLAGDQVAGEQEDSGPGG